MNTGRKLFKLCNWYAFKIEGSIRSDMAKRIMYSVIPHVATPAERQHAGGIVDYKALRAAVEGAKDVIKYGTRAAIGEIGFYDPNGRGGSDFRNKLQKLEKEAALKFDDRLPVYENILQECVKLFGDYKKWAQSYGGKAWEQIAKTLLKLCQLQQNFDLVRIGLSLNDPEYTQEQEISIMKDIIVQLNVFDGLSHNTASILGNLVEQEAQEHSSRTGKIDDESLINKYYGKEPDYSNEFNKIKRLMDIKEYMNPIDVYKELENDLVANGDINRYKDWVSRIRRHPDYAKSGRKPAELFSIRLRKDKILPVLKTLESTIAKMYEIGSRATIHKNKDAKSEVSSLTYTFNSSISDWVYQMKDYNLPSGNYSTELQKVIDHAREKVDHIDSLRKNLSSYRNQHEPEYMTSDIDVAEFVEKYVRMAKEIIHEFHSI